VVAGDSADVTELLVGVVVAVGDWLQAPGITKKQTRIASPRT
jgi:hypothetical protein